MVLIGTSPVEMVHFPWELGNPQLNGGFWLGKSSITGGFSIVIISLPEGRLVGCG